MSEEPDPPQAPPLLTWQELADSVGDDFTSDVSTQEVYDYEFHKESLESERTRAHLDGLRTHYSHKRKWSWFLMGAMSFMIIFQSVLLIFVGLGIWNFSAYRWLLPLLLVQNLAQIIGLAVIVVKSLFTNIDQPLK